MQLVVISQLHYAVYARDPERDDASIFIGVFSIEEKGHTQPNLNGLRVAHEGGDDYHKDLRK